MRAKPTTSFSSPTIGTIPKSAILPNPNPVKFNTSTAVLAKFISKASLTTFCSIIQEVKETYDTPFEYTDEESLGETIHNEIKENTYQPTPNTAFLIKKESGNRLVEQLSFKDLVAQQYLLKTIQPFFERILEPESIGYRIAFSREKAIPLFQEAVKDGYQYLIQSDIEEFFPSVALKTIASFLDFYLPEKDTLLRDLLRSLKNGYCLGGKFYERERGLAQGSPLSPLLANLYLDAFDEKIKGFGVRLIRYGDDFLILTRTKEEAENILTKTESLLSELGLRLAKRKTAIKPIREGFHFLGIRFEKSEFKIEPEEEFKKMKKPLYITEPYLFLSLNGEAVNLIKNRTIIETIPLRRLSEIVFLAQGAISTPLIRKCAEFQVPITLALRPGYFVATIRPDSKKYYDILSAHSQRYYSLSDAEILALAKFGI